uniref:Secreted protein n=1 Tax=Timema shepardi TaxID=629360 RepID=A0A7R9AR19_TIMSH|nr:unnamed protein product [Timema shepardi]
MILFAGPLLVIRWGVEARQVNRAPWWVMQRMRERQGGGPTHVLLQRLVGHLQGLLRQFHQGVLVITASGVGAVLDHLHNELLLHAETLSADRVRLHHLVQFKESISGIQTSTPGDSAHAQRSQSHTLAVTV